MKGRKLFILAFTFPVLFFLPMLLRGEGFFYADNLTYRIPSATFWKQEVLRGSFPRWNPFILEGIPFFADLSNAVLAPTNFLYLLFPVPYALTILTLLSIGLAAGGTYLYVHKLTGREIPSIFSAVTFAFSGAVVASTNDVISLQGIALLPLVLYAAHNWVSGPKRGSAIMLVALLSVQLVSSHPQYSYYTWMLAASYLLLMTKKKAVAIPTVIGVFVATLALSAIQLVPFLEMVNEVYRPESVEFSTANQLKMIELPRFVIANFYGSWRNGSSWGPGAQLETGLGNTEGYMGLFPLILALWVAVKGKLKPVRFWAWAAGLALMMSFGDQTPLFPFAHRVLPLFSKFRSPIRILALYSFAIAVLAGLGMERLEKRIR